MRRVSSALIHGATRLSEGVARAAVLAVADSGDNTVRDLHPEPGCEPIWIDDARTVIRRPREGARDLILGGARTSAVGFDAAAVGGFCFQNDATGYRVAAAESAFPSPLRELTSTDVGATWKATRVLWGSAAGHACGAYPATGSIVVFEGGDKARREHILMLAPPPPAWTLPTSAPSAPK
jgi:hypothetical protein